MGRAVDPVEVEPVSILYMPVVALGLQVVIPAQLEQIGAILDMKLKERRIRVSQIRVKAVDQNIVFVDTPRIFSGDVNTDIVSFEFDTVWDGYLKTAVFYKDIENPYFVVMTGNECVIPSEVIATTGKLHIGVVGVLDDKVITSEVVVYDINQGAVTPMDVPLTEDIWQQILAELRATRILAQQLRQDQEEYQAKWEQEVDGSIKEAQQATVQCWDAISALQLEVFDMDGGDPFAEPSDDDLDANGGYPS